MPNNDVLYIDQNTPPLTFRPAVEDAGGGVRRSIMGVVNSSGNRIDPMPASGGSVNISAGSVAIVAVPIAIVRSAVLEASRIFKPSAGNLLDTDCSATVNGWYMIFDLAAVPADGIVTPMFAIPVGAGQTSGREFGGLFPASFANGLVGVFSTTGPVTKTASATAFMTARFV